MSRLIALHTREFETKFIAHASLSWENSVDTRQSGMVRQENVNLYFLIAVEIKRRLSRVLWCSPCSTVPGGVHMFTNIPGSMVMRKEKQKSKAYQLSNFKIRVRLFITNYMGQSKPHGQTQNQKTEK